MGRPAWGKVWRAGAHGASMPSRGAPPSRHLYVFTNPQLSEPFRLGAFNGNSLGRRDYVTGYW